MGETFPLEMGFLPEFFQRKAEEELKYTEENRKRSLKELKEAIAKDDVLKRFQLSDELYLLFLNCKKYHVEETTAQIKKFLKYRKDALYMFTNITFEALSHFISSDLLTFLPWRCTDGCAIGLMKLGNWDAEKHPIVPFKQAFLTMISQCLRDPMTHVNGFKCIVDLRMGPHVLKICTPANLYHLYCGVEKVLPGRVKAYHVVNLAAPGRLVMRIIELFISEKVKKRIHIHNRSDALLKYFPMEVLPVEYGGKLKDCNMMDWLRKVTTPKEMSFFDVTVLETVNSETSELNST